MFDCIIKNAAIIDGTGSPSFTADIALAQGKIAAIGNISADAEEVMDASGLTLAPGFIDVHGHSDLFAFVDPLRASKLCQGITTEICGQCGLGPAPVSEEFYPHYTGYFQNQGAPIYPECKQFTNFGAYLKHMDTLPLGINLVYFIPHGTVRMAVMGLSPAAPTPSQLCRMQDMVEDAMQNGAVGLSSGLMYAPGSFAHKEELEALCHVIGRYNGIYSSHIRDQSDFLEQSVQETITVAQHGGARANISHHKASGRQNWGKVTATCRMIREAAIPVTHDVYPYAASSTVISSTVPPRYLKMGSDMLLRHLQDAAYHKAFESAIFQPEEEFENPLLSCGYDGILIINATVTEDAIGKTITQYAKFLGTTPFQAYMKLLVDNALAVTYIGFSMSEQDVDTLIRDPLCMFGTDALYVAGMPMTHPRAIGSFPRILAKSVREKQLITLPEAIRKMTLLPAETYGIKNKGWIAVGYDADLVLFNAQTINDFADYTAPLLPNTGIARVYVNGSLAVENDNATGVKNGRVVRVR